MSEEQEVDASHVEEIWRYTMDKISGWLGDPMAPKVLINGFMTLRPDIKFLNKQIFVYLHKLRKAENQDYRRTLRNNINRLMKIRRRINK